MSLYVGSLTEICGLRFPKPKKVGTIKKSSCLVQNLLNRVCTKLQITCIHDHNRCTKSCFEIFLKFPLFFSIIFLKLPLFFPKLYNRLFIVYFIDLRALTGGTLPHYNEYFGITTMEIRPVLEAEQRLKGKEYFNLILFSRLNRFEIILVQKLQVSFWRVPVLKRLTFMSIVY